MRILHLVSTLESGGIVPGFHRMSLVGLAEEDRGDDEKDEEHEPQEGDRAANPEHAPDLRKMQKLYDQSVASWKADAVPYNNYQPFCTFFDRNIPWDQKQLKPAPKPKNEKSTKKSRKKYAR